MINQSRLSACYRLLHSLPILAHSKLSGTYSRQDEVMATDLASLILQALASNLQSIDFAYSKSLPHLLAHRDLSFSDVLTV